MVTGIRRTMRWFVVLALFPHPCWLSSKSTSARQLWRFFLGLSLSLPMLALPWLVRDRRLRVAWFILTAVFLSSLMVPWNYPHYLAPAAPLLFLICIQGLRYLRCQVRRDRPWARLAVPAVVAMHVAGLFTIFQQYANSAPGGTVWQRPRTRRDYWIWPLWPQRHSWRGCAGAIERQGHVKGSLSQRSDRYAGECYQGEWSSWSWYSSLMKRS